MTLTRTISSEEPEPECEDSGFEREKDEDWRHKGTVSSRRLSARRDKGKEQQLEKGWSCWRVS